MSIDLQIILDEFSYHSNDIDVLNVYYSFNLFVTLNSFSKSRTVNKFIAIINISLNQMKTLIVMIIARNNSIMSDIKLYSKATRYLDKLTRRLTYEIFMNKRKTRIINEYFMT